MNNYFKLMLNKNLLKHIDSFNDRTGNKSRTKAVAFMISNFSKLRSENSNLKIKNKLLILKLKM